jgi:hypothetical protein
MHVQLFTHIYENATSSFDLKMNKYKEAKTCMSSLLALLHSPASNATSKMSSIPFPGFSSLLKLNQFKFFKCKTTSYEGCKNMCNAVEIN